MLAALAAAELAAAVALRAVVAARRRRCCCDCRSPLVSTLVVTVARLVTGAVARNIGAVAEVELPFRLRLVDGSVAGVDVAARPAGAAGGSSSTGAAVGALPCCRYGCAVVSRPARGRRRLGREAPVISRI